MPDSPWRTGATGGRPCPNNACGIATASYAQPVGLYLSSSAPPLQDQAPDELRVSVMILPATFGLPRRLQVMVFTESVENWPPVTAMSQRAVVSCRQGRPLHGLR